MCGIKCLIPDLVERITVVLQGPGVTSPLMQSQLPAPRSSVRNLGQFLKKKKLEIIARLRSGSSGHSSEENGEEAPGADVPRGQHLATPGSSGREAVRVASKPARRGTKHLELQHREQ